DDGKCLQFTPQASFHPGRVVIPASANPEREIPVAGDSLGSFGDPLIHGAAMARIISTATGAEALTFDDVLLQPGHSDVLPSEADISTVIAGDVQLNLPIISSAMDTVTEARLA